MNCGRRLEREFGEQLFYQTGSIDMGPEDSEVFSGSLRSCLENEFEHEVLDSRQLTARFPVIACRQRRRRSFSHRAACSCRNAASARMPSWRNIMARNPCRRAGTGLGHSGG